MSNRTSRTAVAIPTIKFTIRGTAAMLHHNERLANPLDPYAKEMSKIAGKRKKTEADHELLSKTEFVGGMYHDDRIGPYVPAKWIDSGLVEGGTREKLGETIKRVCRCVEDQIPIQYDGPRDIQGLWDANYFDRRTVVVRRNRTLRTRPCFNQWLITFNVLYDDSELEADHIHRALERLGRLYGIGDYTPRFGRFDIEETING